MDQNSGTTPPAADTPTTENPTATTPPAGDTSSPTTPATPAADPATPAGPPPVGETPSSESHDTGSTPAATTDPATPAAETPKTDAPDHTTPASPSSGGASEHKSISKPILVVVGLLAIGALSAVFIVSSMHPGGTQSSAHQVTQTPALPTATPATTDTMMQDPNLTITSPTPNSVVTIATVTVSGKTFPNAEVFIGEKELKADANGMFSTTVTVDEGDNSILVTANDANGNAAETEVAVTYQAE